MPNTKSSIRRVKKTSTQTWINRTRKSKYKSAIKKMSAYISAGKMKEAKENETYKIGDELDCTIKSFDKKNQKIVLALSQEDK